MTPSPRKITILLYIIIMISFVSIVVIAASITLKRSQISSELAAQARSSQAV